tara:strand:- start:2019 stop:3083 length:1065 start_codon:yes stop_codon:yes gene_type:complete
MAFLDRKEQVMDTQLTQYGKRLLAQGKFKPAYYAFYDDDIIYDLNWCADDETQNESENRIKESLRSETQYVFSGIETKIKEQSKTLTKKLNSSDKSPEIQNEADRDFIIDPLGTANPHSQYFPAWDINFLEGTHADTVEKIYKSGSLELRIPQIEVDYEYNVKIGQEFHLSERNSESAVLTPEGLTGLDAYEKVELSERAELLDEDFRAEHIFEDDTFHYLDESKAKLFLRVLEKNSEFLNDNFDLEVFLMNEDNELKKLFFIQDKINNIVDGILLDKSNLLHVEGFGPDYVEYYFDLLTDQEIDNDLYCEAVKNPKLENIFSDEEMFNCNDLPSKEQNSDIYRISEKIDEDPC